MGESDTAGVGTGGTGSGPIIRYAMAGMVADGYLVNATVFLDKNANYQLDDGEPFATTDENGAYTLKVDPADIGGYPIVALAIKGVTIDKDNNLPVSNSYVLSMPKESIHGVASNFISPISSQLRELMETGEYATVHQAAEALRVKMGLPTGADLQADYVAARNRTIHAAAQNIAALMGGQADQVLVENGSAVAVDVKRYRCMMNTIGKNLPGITGEKRQNAVQCLNAAITAEVIKLPRERKAQMHRKE
ncbi:MAG: hypothetical protein PHN92_05530 [Geobacter sp.]|nr:hypothetical protein [Geobacter sp.]